MRVRLGRVVSNPTAKGDGTPMPFIALEHIEPKSGQLLTGVELMEEASGDAVLVDPGDVVYGKLRPYLVKTLAFDQAGSVSPELLVLRPGPEILSCYLRYLVLSTPFIGWATATAYGVKMPRTSWSELRQYSFDLPSLSHQKSIADYLDPRIARMKLTAAQIRMHKGLVGDRTASAIAESLSRSPLGYATTGSGLPWLPVIPAHWRVVPLKEFARLESGHTPSRSDPTLWEDCYIPWISLNDVGAMAATEFIDTTQNLISDAGIAASSARLLPAGTVVLSRDATIGRSSIMARPMATSQHFADWVCGPLLKPRFLWLLFTTVMQPYFDSLTAGATLRTIGMDDLRSFKIPLPPVDEQDAIVQVAEQLRRHSNRALSEIDKQLALLAERREALITNAVTGQLNIGKAA